MRFSAEHCFDAAPADVASVLGDPDFYRHLQLPDLDLLEVTGHVGDGRGAHVALRYEFTGHLDPMARRLLGGERLTWTQDVRLRGSEGGRLSFAAEANPRLLHGSADFTLDAGDGPGTVRRLSGELVLALPALGRMAERRIVPGVLTRLDVEADALRRRLA